MKKIICLVLIVVALLSLSVMPGYAYRDGHFSVWISPGWGGWWWGPSAYAHYYWQPPVVIQEQPSVYVQPTPQPEEQYYWYFCPDSRNYYPYVKQCPKGWLRVVPPQTSSGWRE